MTEVTTYFESPVGTILVSGNEEWITRLCFTSGITILPSITTPVPSAVNKCLDQLHQYFEGKPVNFSVPCRQTGTDFQQKVWQQLTTIGFGNTSSYRDLAIKVSGKGAVRAVGTANARNNILLLIPCHRIVGSKRDLVGYSGELWRKKWLLEHEAIHAHGVQTLF